MFIVGGLIINTIFADGTKLVHITIAKTSTKVIFALKKKIR